MDTNPNQYSNIAQAVREGPQKANLTYQQQADNYNTFSELMKQNVYLPDLVKRLDALEAKVRELDRPHDQTDRELFAVMEKSVKDDPEVRRARERMASEKTRVLTDLCIKDPGFQEAYSAYKKTVGDAYIKQKERGGRGPL